MPNKVTYANRYGQEIEDTINELEYDSSDDDDSSYSSSDNHSSDDSLPSDSDNDSDSDDSDSDSDDSNDGDGDEFAHDEVLNLPPPPDVMDPNPDINIGPMQQQPPEDALAQPHGEPPRPRPLESRQHVRHDQGNRVNNAGVGPHDLETTGVQPPTNVDTEHNTAEIKGENTGVRGAHPDEPTINQPATTRDTSISYDDPDDKTITESERIAEAEQLGRDGAASGNDTERPVRKNRGQYKHNDYAYLLDSCMNNHENQFSLLIDLISTGDPTRIFKSLQNGTMDDALTLVTEQMSAKKGLKVFGASGADAIKKSSNNLYIGR